MLPNGDPAYNFDGAGGVLTTSDFSPTGVVCAAFYSGTVTFTVCSTDGGPYGVAGCEDIDECSASNGGCSDFNACINNVGGAATCVDINECATSNGNCGDAALFYCTNNDGAAATCGDIDECIWDNGGCQGGCTNNMGAERTCTCRAGFGVDSDNATHCRECSDGDAPQWNAADDASPCSDHTACSHGQAFLYNAFDGADRCVPCAVAV